MDIQDTTSSVDAIGNRICSSWNKVNRANESQRFDIVIIGAGMFGAYCAEKLFRRDTSKKKLRILVLDAGPFFLPTHVKNLPLSGMSNAAVWTRPWTGNDAFLKGGGSAFCVGGRSLFWAGWAPELMPDDLKKWPEDVRNFLNSDEGYESTAIEIGSKESTDFIAETDTYKRLDEAFQAARKKEVFGEAQIDLIKEAPLAVQGSPPAPGIFPFDQYSSVTFLIDAISQDLSNSEDVDKPGDRRLMLLPRAEVIRLNRDSDAVTSLDLEVRGDAKTLRLGPNTTVILANGTVEATRLALAHLGVGKPVSGRPRVGNFMAHMGNSISVRIKRSALGLSDKPSRSESEVAAFIARGTAHDRRFHFQIVAAALQGGGQRPWDAMMRMIPDMDQVDQLVSGSDPQWISFVFRGIAEMEDDRRPDAADKWTNWISLEETGDRAYANLNPSEKDKKLWKAMDKAAIDLAKQLAPNPQDIEYWWGDIGDKGWQSKELDLKSAESFHDGIGTSQHEGGTLFMGDKGRSITDAYGKFHHLSNVYVVGPAVFPTIGDANPSLTGLSLARRTADAILTAHGITPPRPRQPPLVA